MSNLTNSIKKDPDKMKLGICGSGQLSMMLCQASKKLNIETIVPSDSEYGPAKLL